MTFGDKLSSLRKQANLTQSDIANKLNVSRQAVNKWEKGSCLPDIDNIQKLSSIFNVSIDELLDYKIENISLELNTKEELINRENSKLKNVDNFVLNKFKAATSIERLSREKKLTFWQEVFDFFIGAGTLEMADLIGSGLVYSYLVEENKKIKIVNINKDKLFIKTINVPFEKSIIIDGYKYTRHKNNKLK